MGFFQSLLGSDRQFSPLEFLAPVTLDGEDWNVGDRSPGEPGDMFPTVMYDSEGRTVCSIAYPWSDGMRGFGGLISYDKYGFYPATVETTLKTFDVDRHNYPAAAQNENGDYIIVQERTHIGNMYIYKLSKDLSKSVQVSYATDECARIQLYKSPTGFAILYQYQDKHIAIRTCDENGGSLSARQVIVNNDLGSGIRIYSNPVLGTFKPINGWYYFAIEPRYSTGNYIRASYLIKTQDFATFYNYQETHSFLASGIDMSDIVANNYLTVSDGSVSIGVTPYCVDHKGNIFKVAHHESSNLITTYWTGSAWANITSADTFDLSVPFGSTTPVKWLAKRGSTLWAIVMIDNGTVGKPHLFKSDNIGLHWTDLGDMCPGLNDSTGFYRMVGPMNANDIPDDRNFMIYASELAFDNVTGKFADLYGFKAAFGTIQSEISLPEAETISAMNDISGARFIYETDSMSSGKLVDKSSVGRTMTTTGSPTLSSGELIFDGVDDSYQLANIADFLSDSAFTIFFVGRWLGTVTGERYVLSGCYSTANNVWGCVGIEANAGPTIQARNADAATARFKSRGIENTTDGNFKIYTYKGDGEHYRNFTNGKENNKVYTINPAVDGDLRHNGKWASHSANAWSRMRIGCLARNNIVFSNLGLKAIAYWPSCLPSDQQRSIEKFLANKYSITLEG